MRINVTRSSMPDFEEFCQEIRPLWDSHWLTNNGEKLLEPLRMLTFPQTFHGEDRNTEIVCASLGNDAGLVGAAMLVE